MASYENSNRDNHLEELGGSGYKIVEGQPDIKGWSVKDGLGRKLGEVDELLFHPQSRQVRYIVLDLEGNVLDLDTRDVLIPIGIAELEEDNDDVILPNVSKEQILALPDYDKSNINPETEQRTRNVLTGAFIEGGVHDSSFYEHEHFNERNLYRRREARQMRKQTVVGIFDSGFDAQNAVNHLKKEGFTDEQVDIQVRDNTPHDHDDNDSALVEFFSNLFTDNDEKAHFTEVAKRGSIVSVHTNAIAEAEKAAAILDQHGAIDVDERYNQYQQQSSVGTSFANSANRKLRSKIIDKRIEDDRRFRSSDEQL